MKCPLCNGRKKILEPCDGALLGTVLVTCYACNGTGEVTMTNEEWFCGLSTEEKATWLSDALYACMRCGIDNREAYCHVGRCIIEKEHALEWLKEKHKE